MVFLGVVGAGLLIGWLLRSGDVDTARVGSPAPDFVVELLDGGEFRLSDHLDTATGPLVLNLWASWCIPCQTEMPDIDEFSRNNPDIAVLGVAVRDQRQDSIDFAGTVDVSYPLAFGSRDFETSYPTIGLPVTYVINRDGVVTALRNGIVDAETLQELVDR